MNASHWTGLGAVALAAGLILGGCAAAAARDRGARGQQNLRLDRWICMYGDDLAPIFGAGLDLAILNGSIQPPPADTARLSTGYVNLGEADEDAWYWSEVRGQSWLIEDNPNWPGAHRVDVRSAAWRDLVVQRIAPRVLAKGYRGLFLDTVDSAEWLEEREPRRFAGMRQAMVELIVALRTKFPDAMLIANRGFEILDRIAPSIDALLVESVFHGYDFERQAYRRVPEAERRELVNRLSRFARDTGKPVLVLDYADPADTTAIQASTREARKLGFSCYVGTIELDRPFLR